MYSHLKILDFAVFGILRERLKNSVIIMVYTLNVFLIVSAVFLSDALFEETRIVLEGAPELIVQNLKGGRHEMLPLDYAGKIRSIRGVQDVVPRYWGYYYDPQTTANYTFMGVENLPTEIVRMIEGGFQDSPPPGVGKKGNFIYCVVGQGVADARFIGVDDIIPILGSDGNLYVLKVTGIFESASSLLTNDLVLVGETELKTIFDLPKGHCTDFVVVIRNAREVDTIIGKIQQQLPMTRSISRSQILGTYRAVFGWRSGVAIMLLAGSTLAFVVLAADKAFGISAQERRSIGILKAIGWKTSDVLELKFWEGFVISSASFLTGMLGAFIHVFYFGGILFSPVIRGWSVLFPSFRPLLHIDGYKLLVVLFLTVVPYVAATILPAWHAAVIDPDEVMR